MLLNHSHNHKSKTLDLERMQFLNPKTSLFSFVDAKFSFYDVSLQFCKSEINSDFRDNDCELNDTNEEENY